MKGLLIALLFFGSGVVISGLVQTPTGTIRIGGITSGWHTLTVNDVAGPDTKFYLKGTGRQDEVIATERKCGEMIAAAMGNPSPSPSPLPSPTLSPTPPPSPSPVGYSVSGPSTASAGSTITVSWSAPAGHSAKDWVGLFRVGTDDRAHGSAWRYISTGTSGLTPFPAPAAGQYEFRLFTNDGYTKVATSGRVTTQ